MTTDPAYPQPQASPPKTSGLAIASLVTGLTCISPVAIILGHVALSKIKKSGGTLTGGGLAIAGLILGYVSLVINVLMVINILFVGSRAWKEGADRAGCIMSQRNFDQAIQAHANINNLEVGAPLDVEAIKQEYGLQSMVDTCPKGGSLSFSTTYLGPNEPHVTCPNDSHTIDYDFSY